VAAFPLGYNNENYQLKIRELLLDIKIHNTKLYKVFDLERLSPENSVPFQIATKAIRPSRMAVDKNGGKLTPPFFN